MSMINNMRHLYIILLILPLIVLFSCSPPIPEYDLVNLYCQPDVDPLCYDKKDGSLITGKVFYYYPDGQIMTESHYVDGVKHGLLKEYYENGQIKQEINYPNGEKGDFRYYYENGQISEDYFFRDEGLFYGWYKTYHRNGQLRREIIWDSSKEVSRKCWDEKGNKVECE